MAFETFSWKRSGNAMKRLLDVNNLRVGYKIYKGSSKVLNGLSFTVHEGEKVGIIGESGSGKTTAMRAILRVLASNAIVESGEISFKGKDILKINEKELTEIRRKNITMIFQDPTAALNPVFTAGDQLANVIKYSGIIEGKNIRNEDLKAKSLELLKDVALQDPERVLNSYPFQLSGGMKQRICIAMSLGTARDLLIADEPTTNLDVTIQDQVLHLMSKLVSERNLSVILISHALGTIRGITDRGCVMYAGDMIETAATGELFSNPLHPYTRGLLESCPKLTGGGFSKGIRGHVPDYLDPPSGCRFHPRCDHASDVCKREKPQFVGDSDSHLVACWLYNKR
ncbi:MAG: ABC transporter ATP-binding protein [Candidatus Bathyarchaeia archaeon]|jgi:peptide/nickel transport system ATP-binding protein